MMMTNEEIAQMPIHEVVNQPGGNGLASPTISDSAKYSVDLGWHNIEQGVEACVCDGKHIPHTEAKSEFRRLIGRKSFVRRVLLNPSPLEVVSTAITQDEMKLTLSIAIKYEVKNPVYVASLSDPLAELENFFEELLLSVFGPDLLSHS
jgi:hypothetical protein